eukprot:Hpha_TRINITY_DN32086_c0_g1::TRINITY_DN32086_c0_g1_i1::g.115911::m.115911
MLCDWLMGGMSESLSVSVVVGVPSDLLSAAAAGSTDCDRSLAVSAVGVPSDFLPADKTGGHILGLESVNEADLPNETGDMALASVFTDKGTVPDLPPKRDPGGDINGDDVGDPPSRLHAASSIAASTELASPREEKRRANALSTFSASKPKPAESAAVTTRKRAPEWSRDQMSLGVAFGVVGTSISGIFHNHYREQ